MKIISVYEEPTGNDCLKGLNIINFRAKIFGVLDGFDPPNDGGSSYLINGIAVTEIVTQIMRRELLGAEFGDSIENIILIGNKKIQTLLSGHHFNLEDANDLPWLNFSLMKINKEELMITQSGKYCPVSIKPKNESPFRLDGPEECSSVNGQEPLPYKWKIFKAPLKEIDYVKLCACSTFIIVKFN